ncbi:conserved hypothetical protein [Gluconacetobacter diazotrophicus PA1 5]|uniref:Sulfotransferase family protein n=1 Tax=Gluconacetobacter diazotrophicus TaxID=33996 RepID=A0A7W4I5J5_GLUDI|nr:sulfotransferase family protein [Gluconacetobacter diazotrophicus]ACI52657.1 conserved hypothetical protein [Gluconacetobacter diazotrophicus PA1 5]MBB2156410.1 sulfotransferase family protein [Gluconacetobacter diazotrophicus]TWB06064.1 hypothetical protein FBZ86_11354 [Gluconacetobacter diazotrophicus]
MDCAIEDGGRTLAGLVRACADRGPVCITGRDAPSAPDIAGFLRRHGLAPPKPAAEPAGEPAVSIVYSRRFPPRPPLPGRVRVLFLDMDNPAGADRKTAYRTIGNACNYDLLVTSAPDPDAVGKAIRQAYGIDVPNIRSQRDWQAECDAIAARPAIRRSDRDEKTAMVVVGMHRSGTSLVSHLLARAGFDLPTSLMPPGEDNRDGFWESPIIAALNDGILKEYGAGWDRLFSSVRLKDAGAGLDAHVGRIRETIRAQYPDARAIVLKDPRICLLMPVWHRALVAEGYVPRYILTTRHPVEVAMSLQRRNRIMVGIGVFLWADHMVTALEFLRDKPVFAAFFDRLLDAPDAVMARIWSMFAFPPETLPADLSAVAQPSLRHHLEQRPALAVAVKPAWDLYRALADGSGHLPPVAQVEAFRTWLQEQKILLGL